MLFWMRSKTYMSKINLQISKSSIVWTVWYTEQIMNIHTYMHPLNGPLSRTTQVSRTRKVKPIWILLEQETVGGSGIRWAVYKSAPHCRQITTQAPHHSVFTGRMPFLSPNQQRQSTEGLHNCIHWLSCVFTSHSTQNRSFWRHVNCQVSAICYHIFTFFLLQKLMRYMTSTKTRILAHTVQ